MSSLPRLPMHGLRPAMAFPILALPEPLGDYVESAAKAIVCPPDFIAVPMLASCAAAVGNTCRIEVKRGWHEGARFFAAIVAEPGSRKSPALIAATRPVLKEQVRLKNVYQDEFARYKEELAVYEEARRAKELDGTSCPPEKPTLGQVYGSDTTIEALAEILRDNPRGVLLVRDELSGWLRDQGRYQHGRNGERKQWLSLWSGAALVVNRKSLSDPIVLDEPFVNVVGNLIPESLSELLGDFSYSDGFTERFLFAFPDPIPTRWSEVEVAAELDRAVQDLFAKLWALEPETRDGVTGPRTFRLSDQAKAVFRNLLGEHYEEMNGSQFSDALRGAWSKLEAYFARLTLLIHVYRRVQGNATEEIDVETVLRASVLWDYFKAHTRRVVEYIFGTDQDKRIDKALRWIRRQKGREIPVRDFLASKVAGAASMDEVHSLIGELEQLGVGETRTVKGGERGPRRLVFCATDSPAMIEPPS